MKIEIFIILRPLLKKKEKIRFHRRKIQRRISQIGFIHQFFYEIRLINSLINFIFNFWKRIIYIFTN